MLTGSGRRSAWLLAIFIALMALSLALAAAGRRSGTPVDIVLSGAENLLSIFQGGHAWAADDSAAAAGALFAPDGPAIGAAAPVRLPDADGRPAKPPALLPLYERAAPETIRIYDHRRRKSFTLDFEEYIYCVTASEMSPMRAPEALKAQAIAARTYACMKLLDGGCGRGGADICTDSGHCQAFYTKSELKTRWGRHASEADRRISNAVAQTRGIIITYGGRPINALFHASSGGHTEDVENVYSEALPYLRGVASPGEEAYSGYASRRRYSENEFRNIAAQLGMELYAAPLAAQVGIADYTEAGQVRLMRIGRGAVSGRQARKTFGLRSQHFSVSFDADGGITFNVKGFGHGVGMSQNGADAMACGGATFDEILLHYYTGTELMRMAAP